MEELQPGEGGGVGGVAGGGKVWAWRPSFKSLLSEGLSQERIAQILWTAPPPTGTKLKKRSQCERF